MFDEEKLSSTTWPQLSFAVTSPFTFQAQSTGGLQLTLMKNLTDFDYYINIVIDEREVNLG